MSTYLHEELDLRVPIVPISCRRVRHAVGAPGRGPRPERRHLCSASGSCSQWKPLFCAVFNFFFLKTTYFLSVSPSKDNDA